MKLKVNHGIENYIILIVSNYHDFIKEIFYFKKSVTNK